jgi:hypothetical protein
MMLNPGTVAAEAPGSPEPFGGPPEACTERTGRTEQECREAGAY